VMRLDGLGPVNLDLVIVLRQKGQCQEAEDGEAQPKLYLALKGRFHVSGARFQHTDSPTAHICGSSSQLHCENCGERLDIDAGENDWHKLSKRAHSD